MGRPKEKRYKRKCENCGELMLLTRYRHKKLKQKYCSRDCYYEGNSGENHYLYKGRIYDKSGYVLVLKKEHPSCNPNGYVREHRLIMESEIGRYLRQKEVVHHKNGIKDDNRIENLELYTSNSAHMRLEYRSGKLTGINNGKKK